MKRNLGALIFVLFIPFLLNAQNNKGDGDRMGREQMRERIEQMEKIKLIELLNLNEEKSVKFFARRNDQRTNYMKLIHDYSHAIDALEKEIKSGKKVKDSFYKEEVKKVLNIENKMFNSRKNYYYSLKDILTQEQIAKYVVFEVRFREEWRKNMDKERDKK